MVYFMQQGKRFHMTPSQAVMFEEKLPLGTYTVGFCDGSFYFERIDDLTLPKKLYGNTQQNAHRILTTFLDRPFSTGVLLSGQKGSGKTLLAKVVSKEAAEQHGIPTLVINTEACCGDAFNKFLQLMEQPAILIFDEFEKTFGYGSQQELLTLLDGMYPSKKLFMLTTNEKDRIDCNMVDRPGRVFYVLEFEGVDIDFVRGYCADNLIQKEYVPQVVSMFRLFTTFTFDILKALVEEMNRYKENPAKALQLLNARPGLQECLQYEIEMETKGRKLDPEKDEVDKDGRFNIFTSGNFAISYKIRKVGNKTEATEGEEKKDAESTESLKSETEEKEGPNGGYDGWDQDGNGEDGGWGYGNAEDDEYERASCSFCFRDLVSVNSIRGVYKFRNTQGDRLVLTRTNRGGALDLEWLCSLEEPLEDQEPLPEGKGAGQIMEVVRLSGNENYDDW